MTTMQALPTVNKIAFKNILFLTDFTEASQTALAFALGFAKHFDARLFPAHACDPVILTETATPNILDEVEENSRRQLNALAKENNINGTPLFACGPIANAFPGWITENGIDLIVMGTHGRKGLKHLLMGSVAEVIFRNATCPVLTVGPHVTIRPSRGFQADKILFPTDLGTHAKFAAQYALSIAHENQAKVTFMHVISPGDTLHRDRTQVVTDSYKKLETLLPPDAKQWCKPELVVEVGDTVKELLGYAESERPDMIVLGLPAGKKFNGHFRSSVTYNLIAGAACPVMTVRDIPNNN